MSKKIQNKNQNENTFGPFSCNLKLNKNEVVMGQNILLQPLDPNGKSILKRNSNTPTFMTTNFNEFKDRENINN